MKRHVFYIDMEKQAKAAHPFPGLVGKALMGCQVNQELCQAGKAAAAEELSRQAAEVRRLPQRFKLKGKQMNRGLSSVLDPQKSRKETPRLPMA